MNFFRSLRKNNVPKTDSDAIFSLSSAYITLETKLGLKSTGRCALSFKSTSGMYFAEMKDEIQRFLDISKTDFELAYRIITDSYGYLWIILEGKSMEGILAGISAIGDTIEEKGFSSQLLAAVFEFNNGKDVQYLIYSYKRNKFYPFVRAGEKMINTEEDMKIMAAIIDEVPFEKDMTFWYPIWDMPF